MSFPLIISLLFSLLLLRLRLFHLHRPIIGVETMERSELPYRAGGVLALALFAYWLYTQRTLFFAFYD